MNKKLHILARLWHKLAFKITASIGLLFIIMMGLIYLLFSHAVFEKFDVFLEVNQEINISSVHSPSTQANEKFLNAIKQKTQELTIPQLQSWLDEVDLDNEFSVLFISSGNHQIIASNQSSLNDALITWEDEERFVLKTSGDDQIEIIYENVKVYPTPSQNYYVVLPRIQTDFVAIDSPEENFKIAVTSDLLYLLVIFMILGLTIVWWLVNRHTKRLALLSDATLILKNGRFPPLIKLSGNDELKELTIHFNQAFAGFREQEKLRKQMVSDVAHELRTPLTHMRGKVEAMLDGLIQFDLSHVESINHEIIYLTRIVHDLQDLTLAQANELKIYPEPCLLKHEIEDILAGYQYHKSHQSFAFLNLIEPDVYILTDKIRLKQIIINLLDNSLKHSDKKMSIKFEFIDRENKHTLVLTDNGPGIPQDKIDYIFKRNNKISTGSEITKSMGLGLSIVQELTRLQNIKIDVTSEPGNTKFKLDFIKSK